MKEESIELDFRTIFEVSHYSCRRASVFLGIAENAAQIDPPVSHALGDRSTILLIEDDISPEKSRGFVSEFLNWTISNALREIMEGHSMFLSEAYRMVSQIDKPRMSANELNDKYAKFSRKSVTEKRRIMYEQFDVKDIFAEMFFSMTKARNSLAHRNGIISIEDLNNQSAESLDIYWKFLGMRTKKEDGEFEYADVNRGINDEIKEGQSINVSLINQKKSYQIGDRISLDRHDLAEIIVAFLLAGQNVTDNIVEFGRKRGIVEFLENPPDNPTNQEIPSGPDLFSNLIRIAKD